MTKIPELGLDDSLPGMQCARAGQRELRLAGKGPYVEHAFCRLPSYEGYAGMCVCGTWESEPCTSFGQLTKAFGEHVDAVLPTIDHKAVLTAVSDRPWVGEVLGHRRLVEASEERGITHQGWLVAGTKGFVEFDRDTTAAASGPWRPLQTADADSGSA